ncbi:MAG TPA: hypothetical protein VF766_15160 [Pyrinomonadaceae bacterium]
MRYICAVLFCVVGLLTNLCAASAQELGAESSLAVASQKTIAPADSRFEIIQTTSFIKATLKLDKYTGTVYELVRNKDLVRAKDEEFAWSVTKRLQHPLDKIDSNSIVNYQIITSAVGIRYTFLINIHTGATWKLAADPDKEQSYWYPIKSQ